MHIRNLNQSDIAEIANISKQSVSLWFKSGSDFQNIQVLHLLNLSKGLGVSVDDLTKPLEVFSSTQHAKELYTEFCWDNLYPDLIDFFVALIKDDYRAIARLIENRGLYLAVSALGEIVWRDFALYKKYIHPIRRKECEVVWQNHQDQI